MRSTSALRVASVTIASALAACTGSFGGGPEPSMHDAAADVTRLDAALDAPRAADAPGADVSSDVPNLLDAPLLDTSHRDDDAGTDAAAPLRCGGGVCRSEFVFHQQSNGMPLPSEPTGNGYIKVNFPSHSRVATPLASTMSGAQASSAWWLYTSDGTLVASLEDDVGGFHPGFFDAAEVNDPGNPEYDRFRFVRDWIAAFVAFGPFPDARSRGNNHLPDYDRYVLEGTYRWRYHNRASIPVRLECGLIRASSGRGDVDRIVAPDETVEVMLEIRANPSDAFDNYKLNTNGY